MLNEVMNEYFLSVRNTKRSKLKEFTCLKPANGLYVYVLYAYVHTDTYIMCVYIYIYIIGPNYIYINII